MDWGDDIGGESNPRLFGPQANTPTTEQNQPGRAVFTLYLIYLFDFFWKLGLLDKEWIRKEIHRIPTNSLFFPQHATVSGFNDELYFFLAALPLFAEDSVYQALGKNLIV